MSDLAQAKKDVQKYEMQIHDIEMELEKLTGKKNIKPRKEKEAELEKVKSNIMYQTAIKQLANAEAEAKIAARKAEIAAATGEFSPPQRD